MALNVVEILVRAKNETEAAFAEADATAGGFSKALKTSMLVGAGAVALVGYEAVKMATSFQSSMETLVTQAGVPQANLKGLQQDVLNLAGQVGFSPDSLAESLYHVASNMESLGGTSQQMMNVVRVAAEGAKTGGADLVDVTNALTAAVASGIPGVKNYSQAMGMLNATVGAGDMKMQDLAEAFGSGMVATVKGFGLSLKDVGAALATFGDNNIRGAHAGTQLRMSVMALAVPAKAGQQQLQAWGYSANRLASDMRSGGLLKALDDLHSMFIKNGITAKEQGDVITNMFGKKAGAGLNVLMDQLGRLQSKYPAIAKGAKDFGDAWAKTNDTLAQKLADLRGKFDAVMTSIGEKLIPVLTRMASFILSTVIPAIGKIVNWLARHRDVVIAVAAGIMTLLIPAFVAWAVAAASAAVATIAAAAPLILIAAGVALVVFAILSLAKHWKQVWHDITAWARDGYRAVAGFFERMWRDVSGFAERIWHDVTGFISRMETDAVLFVARMWTDVTGFFGRMWNDVVQFAGRIWNDVTSFFARLWHDVTNYAGRLVSDVVNWFEQLPGRIIRALSSLPGMLFSAGVNAISGLIHGIESMAGAVGSAVSGIAHKVAGFFGLSPAKEGPLSGGGAPEIRGRHFVQAFARGMTDGLPDLGRTVASVAGRAGGFGPGVAGATGYGRLEIVVSYDQSARRGLGQGLLADLRYTVNAVGGGNVQAAFGSSS